MSEIQKEKLFFFLFPNESNFTEERRKVTIKRADPPKNTAFFVLSSVSNFGEARVTDK